MALSVEQLVPADSSPFLNLAPNISTCVLWDQWLYLDGTPVTEPPTVTLLAGATPIRSLTDKVSLFAGGAARAADYLPTWLQEQGASAVNDAGTIRAATQAEIDKAAGTWFVEVPTDDPDLSPDGYLFVQVAHNLIGRRTVIVPAASTKLSLFDANEVNPPTFPAPIVIGGSGGSTVAALDDLTDVAISGAVSGQSLVFNGSGWVNGSTSSAVQSVNGESGTVTLTAGDVGAAPASHEHPVSQISDATLVGEALVKAPDAAAGRTAIDAAASSHQHSLTEISDITDVGTAVASAATPADARLAIGASSLALGTSSTTALAGDTTAEDIGGVGNASGTTGRYRGFGPSFPTVGNQVGDFFILTA